MSGVARVSPIEHALHRSWDFGIIMLRSLRLVSFVARQLGRALLATKDGFARKFDENRTRRVNNHRNVTCASNQKLYILCFYPTLQFRMLLRLPRLNISVAYLIVKLQLLNQVGLAVKVYRTYYNARDQLQKYAAGRQTTKKVRTNACPLTCTCFKVVNIFVFR